MLLIIEFHFAKFGLNLICSSIPEWNNCVLDSGELFFIKCSPIIHDVSTNTERESKANINRSKSNKFSTFLKKRKSKKHPKSKAVNVTRTEKNEATSANLKVSLDGN